MVYIRKRPLRQLDNAHLTVRTRSQRRAEQQDHCMDAEVASLTKNMAQSPAKTTQRSSFHTPPSSSGERQDLDGEISGFRSCLEAVSMSSSPALSTPSADAIRSEMSPRSLPTVVLRRALSVPELGDESWLTSSFMNLVLTQFARAYQNIRYFSVDFVHLHSNETSYADEKLTDIIGRPWLRNFNRNSAQSSLVFFVNSQSIHWTLVRAVLSPEPELQYFEPMGLPTRGRGLSHRCIPRCISRLLDSALPLPHGRTWMETGVSAVTEAHQITSFDCGVACLLYAEKCGLAQSKDQINAGTSQSDITAYRRVLQLYLERLDER